MLAVASGKGGVGKSSISVNLAVALARSGARRGPARRRHLGPLRADGCSRWTGNARSTGGKIIPFERAVGTGLLKVISMGFLSGEDEAIMWRGLMLNRAVQHFLEDVRWGALDYLVIDLPPGTGDVQMGLARMVPRTEVLVVTTPNQAAEKVAGRVADMARRGHVRVAGVIENMSAFTCEHGGTYEIFGSGGGRRLAERIGVPLVGSVPLGRAHGRLRRRRRASGTGRGRAARRGLRRHRRACGDRDLARWSRWPAAAPACSSTSRRPSGRLRPCREPDRRRPGRW